MKLHSVVTVVQGFSQKGVWESRGPLRLMENLPGIQIEAYFLESHYSISVWLKAWCRGHFILYL